MADILTKKKRSDVMARIRGRGNNDTEVVMVKLLRLHKLNGWRRHVAPPGEPDFAFHAQRLALFVDGSFWHGCAKHCRMPSSNRDYWLTKIARNKTRDRLVTTVLRKRGWRVIRVWEHELAKKNERRLVQRIRRSLRQNCMAGKPVSICGCPQ